MVFLLILGIASSILGWGAIGWFVADYLADNLSYKWGAAFLTFWLIIGAALGAQISYWMLI